MARIDLVLRGGRRPVLPVLVGLVSIADRDLTRFVIPDGGVFQDFSLVLVPGTRLDSLARAGARGVRRSARTGQRGEREETTLRVRALQSRRVASSCVRREARTRQGSGLSAA